MSEQALGYSPSLLERVADELAVRSVLREIIALAEQESVLTDPQVRAQLAALAGTAHAACREQGGTNEAPAAHRRSPASGVQPGPEDPARLSAQSTRAAPRGGVRPP